MPLIDPSLFSFNEPVTGSAVDVVVSILVPGLSFVCMLMVEMDFMGLLLQINSIVISGFDFFGLQEICLRDGCVLYVVSNFFSISCNGLDIRNDPRQRKYFRVSRAPQRGLRKPALLRWG